MKNPGDPSLFLPPKAGTNWLRHGATENSLTRLGVDRLISTISGVF
jgi:hypothetical protein